MPKIATGLLHAADLGNDPSAVLSARVVRPIPAQFHQCSLQYVIAAPHVPIRPHNTPPWCEPHTGSACTGCHPDCERHRVYAAFVVTPSPALWWRILRVTHYWRRHACLPFRPCTACESLFDPERLRLECCINRSHVTSCVTVHHICDGPYSAQP